jgi:hypothetical protein
MQLILNDGHDVKWYSLLLLCSLLQACAFVQSKAESLPALQASESHVLLRVIPPDATVVVREGDVKNGLWVPNFWRGSYQTSAENGLAIFTLPAGKMWAMDRLLLASTQGEAEVEFRACNGLKALVFTTAPGAHIYLADVMTHKQAGNLSVQYLKDLADVRTYSGESGIADGQIWIDQPYQLVPSMQSCVDKAPEAVKTIRRVRRYR